MAGALDDEHAIVLVIARVFTVVVALDHAICREIHANGQWMRGKCLVYLTMAESVNMTCDILEMCLPKSIKINDDLGICISFDCRQMR